MTHMALVLLLVLMMVRTWWVLFTTLDGHWISAPEIKVLRWLKRFLANSRPNSEASTMSFGKETPPLLIFTSSIALAFLILGCAMMQKRFTPEPEYADAYLHVDASTVPCHVTLDLDIIPDIEERSFWCDMKGLWNDDHTEVFTATSTFWGCWKPNRYSKSNPQIITDGSANNLRHEVQHMIDTYCSGHTEVYIATTTFEVGGN